MKLTCIAALAAASFVVASAHAAEAQHTFNLTLDVDTFLTITHPNGDRLDNDVPMTFTPELGLSPYTVDTTIATNSRSAVNVALQSAAKLSGQQTKQEIGLKVSLDGKPITVNNQQFSQEDLAFTGFQSQPLKLRIEADAPANARFLQADNYSGEVVLKLQHATAAL